MAKRSKCPKCEHTSFELGDIDPKGGKYKMHSIQCASCGSVVGVTPFFNTSTLLEKLAKKLGYYLHSSY